MGVDGCSKGWVGIALVGDRVAGLFAPTIAELEADARKLGEIAVIAVDMPIGLPDSGARKADAKARRFVGPRASSVFWTPVRTILELDAYTSAAQANRELTGARLTTQAFALRMNIREVDARLPTAACRGRRGASRGQLCRIGAGAVGVCQVDLGRCGAATEPAGGGRHRAALPPRLA